MEKKFKLVISTDSYGKVNGHKVFDTDNKLLFSCCDTDDCPGNGAVGFAGYDYIRAIEFGMKLAQEGYTEIEIIEEYE